MSYQVLARKWRPQTFDAVVGQDAITRTLRNALASARIAHAYLFAGPRGIGKTTTARLLARALLCPERTGPEPCGRCAVCRESQAGALMDVIEIDGASNRGIEEIRTLRENVKYAPARGRYKVYIIDEVHQLTEAAFNALLKTLEEPPSHVVFILATTDPRDIPATVLSRVQRFDFRPIAPDALTATLEGILREEAIPFEPGVLPVIVRAAEGSLRDALSLLDTAIAYGNGKLEADALMRESPHPRVELEIATVRATRRPVPQALEDVLKRVDEAQRELRQQALSTPSTAAPTAQASLLPGAEATPRAEMRRAAAPVATGPRAPAPSGSPPRAQAPPVDADLATAWERVVDEVMRKKPTLGAVLTQVRPRAVTDRELTVVLLGNNFHRDMLADAANKELVAQAVRRCVAGAERVNIVSGGETTGAGGSHPAVQAAIAEFQGEVVAVRPRLPEGEGQ